MGSWSQNRAAVNPVPAKNSEDSAKTRNSSDILPTDAISSAQAASFHYTKRKRLRDPMCFL